GRWCGNSSPISKIAVRLLLNAAGHIPKLVLRQEVPVSEHETRKFLWQRERFPDGLLAGFPSLGCKRTPEIDIGARSPLEVSSGLFERAKSRQIEDFHAP